MPHLEAGQQKSNKNFEQLEKQYLGENLAKFYTATEQSLSGILFLDNNFDINYLNQAAANSRGLERSKIAHKNYFDFIASPYQKDKMFKDIKSEKWEGDMEIINPNVANNLFKICIYSILSPENNLNGYIAIENQVTGQIKKNLKESAERFKIIFDYAPDAYYLLDLQGHIIDGNLAAENLIGYKKNELLGKNITQLNLMDLKQLLIATKLLALNALGKPTGPDELTLRTKNGKKIEVEIRTYPVKIENKILILGIARDISERNKNASKLKESETMYRSLFENSSDAIMTIEPPEWKFTSGNPATMRMFGLKRPEELLTKTPGDLSPLMQPDGTASAIKAKAMIDKAMEQGVNLFEWTHKKNSGEEFTASVLLTRMTISERTLLQATVRDITIRKKTEDELKRKNNELERFNQLAVNRELTMIELKKKITSLEDKLKLNPN